MEDMVALKTSGDALSPEVRRERAAALALQLASLLGEDDSDEEDAPEQ
jgi:hypothetical protein